MTKPLTALLLLLLSATGPRGEPSGIDLHAYWDQRCQSCHGHSSAFARRFLRIEDGRLVGTHHRGDLERFLRQHGLAGELVQPVSEMLKSQLATPGLFSARCARCHGTAAEFARESLVVRDGALVGRAHGRQVVDTLATHGGLAPAEVEPLVERLTQVRREVSGHALE